MNIVVDSDALIKVTKVSLKETLTAHLQVLATPAVQREVVKEGKAGGHGDALRVEANIREGRIHIQDPVGATGGLEEFPLGAGERSALSLYMTADARAILSDDARFLRILEELRIPFLTPGALLVLARRRAWLDGKACQKVLQDLRPLVSEGEYHLTREALEAGS